MTILEYYPVVYRKDRSYYADVKLGQAGLKACALYPGFKYFGYEQKILFVAGLAFLAMASVSNYLERSRRV